MAEMNLQDVVETLIFAAGEPLSVARMSEILHDFPNFSRKTLDEALLALQDKYLYQAVHLKSLASGYCMQTKSQYAPWVQQLFSEKPRKYSQATLEILALIAYEGPLTRGDIEQKRGVAVSAQIFKGFIERNWIAVVGHRDTPGKPALYATTNVFLDYFNLSNLDDLGPIFGGVEEDE